MKTYLLILMIPLFGLVACDKNQTEKQVERQERKKLIDDAVDEFSGLSVEEILEKKYDSLSLNCDFTHQKGDVVKLEDSQSFSANLLINEDPNFNIIHDEGLISIKVDIGDGVGFLDREVVYFQQGYKFEMIYSPALDIRSEYEIRTRGADKVDEDGNVVERGKLGEVVDKSASGGLILEAQAITKENRLQLEATTVFSKNNFRLKCKILSKLKEKYKAHYKVTKLESKK